MNGALRDAADLRSVRILLLEDSDLDAELVGEFIARTGLLHTVTRTVSRNEFLAAVHSPCHDLILADYVLPSFDGLSALALAREHCPDIPFVFVSGTLGEDVAVEALKHGATDYVTKHRLDRLPLAIVRALKEAEASSERRRAEGALQELNATLETRVAERTGEIAMANRELRAEIAERERVEATLRQMQRLEAVGQLTAGVAHDFNNLLTVVIGNIGLLERSASDPKDIRRLGMMRQAAERGATLTAQLLAFSRRQRLDPKPIRLNETVAGMGDLLRSSIGGTVRLETVLHPKLWPALVDPTQLELVILNLAINARDAMAVGGSLTVETSNVTVRDAPGRPEEPVPGDYVVVSVSDTGTGMSAEVLDKAFEPFFTTKEVGKGSGLGLAQVFGFAKQSGGGVRIVTEPGEGTTVKVYLPRAAVEVTAVELSVPAAAGRARGESILVVDDDSLVREVTSALLQDLGYEVIEAGSGGAALDVLAGEITPDLVLLDYAMPGMNGAEVAREVRRRRPQLPILFVTGYADTAAFAGIGEENVILKPFRDDELAKRVRQVLPARGDRTHNVVPLRAGMR